MTRLFNAPRHLVFEAMTKPEHVKQWWGRLGEGYSVPVCEIDLRVGRRVALREPPPQGRGGLLRRVPGDHAAEPARVHRDLRAVSGQRLGGDDGVHRRGRQDANDGDGALSVARGARHGPRVRDVQRRRHQLRPPRRSRCGAAAGASSSAMAKIGFKSVDEYIAAQPEVVQVVLKRVRSSLRKAVPGAEERFQLPDPRVQIARCPRDLFRRVEATLLALSRDGRPRGGVQGRPRTVRDQQRHDPPTALRNPSLSG